jgi:hypothetical protein
MRSKRLGLVGLVLQTALALGCATLISGTSDDVSIVTRPSGARVTVQPGSLTLTTPASLELARADAPYLLTFELAGHEARRSYIAGRANPWIYANILIGGVPGILVDWLTGAYVRLSPTEIDLELTPVRPSEEQ